MMHSLVSFLGLLGCEALETRDSTCISLLIKLEALIDTRLGRGDFSLGVLCRKLLRDHTLLVALEIERRQELILDVFALCRGHA